MAKKLEEIITKEDRLILNEIKKKNLTLKEARAYVKAIGGIDNSRYNERRIEFPDNTVKFIAFGDAHIGHKNYRPDILKKMIADGKRQNVDFYVNCGDTIEGMSGREGHIYELEDIGASAQLEHFAEEFKQFDRPVYSIEAQGSHGGWYNSKGNMGLNIGEELDRRAKHYEFIGYDEQDLVLDNGFKLRLRHPGGGTAYAISYKMQKYIESMSGGKKPHMVIQGHFHKMNYLFHRNVHGIDVGALQEQSPFMKKIGTPSHIGYWVIEANMHDKKAKGVERIKAEFVPFYE